VVVLEIARAFPHPVKFSGEEYIRVGSYKKKLKEYPEKERSLWRLLDKTPFEQGIAAERVSSADVVRLLDAAEYFRLLGLQAPSGEDRVLEPLAADRLIRLNESGSWDITN